jgi:hypothetical protein
VFHEYEIQNEKDSYYGRNLKWSFSFITGAIQYSVQSVALSASEARIANERCIVRAGNTQPHALAQRANAQYLLDNTSDR